MSGYDRGYKGTQRFRYAPLETRFLAKVAVPDDPEACWEWQAGRNNKGYGNFDVKGQTAKAHRVAYELFVGPIPDGHQIDHLCRNPGCVNPSHLEPVTHRENLERGRWPHNSHKTHCKRGHEFTPENTRFGDRGNRICLACRRFRERAARAARRAARAAA